MQSPFFDQAETHLFSDWLIPSVFGYGVEDLNEFYVGVFPNLSEFLNREDPDYEFNRARFDRMASKNLLSLGKKLKRLVRGRVWLDLGSGIKQKSVVPRILAHHFGALLYIGVDLKHQKCREEENFGTSKSLAAEFDASDILSYLENFNREHPLFVFCSGVEFCDPKSEPAVGYLDAFKSKIVALMKEGDAVLLGAGNFDLDLSGDGFKKTYGDYYHILWEKKKSSWSWIQNLVSLLKD